MLATDTPLPSDSWPCLVLLCKRPALGHSKQRLAEQIGAQAALVIAKGVLECALEDLEEWPGDKVLAPDHAQHLAWGQSRCPAAECLPQGEGNLGERINQLDRRLRLQGCRDLIFMGSDCPALRSADYIRVMALLGEYDSVLFMARDGGVVLMAANLPWPDLSALPWSTARLGEALIECCHAAGQRVGLAGELFDIDLQQDLLPLHGLLVRDARPARRGLQAALEQLGNVL